jgi:uncharacterized repeat protein (TIGR01451 family)
MRIRFVAPFVLAALGTLLGTDAAAQVVTSFVPGVGSVGEPVQIRGQGFGTDPRIPLTVRFSAGGVSTVVDPTAQRVSDTTIYAHVPNGAHTGPVTVTVGSSSGTSSSDFIVVGLGPYISSVSPNLGSPGDNIYIYGWHLTNSVNPLTPTVRFNGLLAPDVTGFASGDQLRVRVPNGATTGPITVTTTRGSSNSPTPFTLTGTGPYISGFSPNYGAPGTVVQVSGVHFSAYPSSTTVSFNGKLGTNVVITQDTFLTVNVPAGATTGRITVTSPAGSHTNANLFYVQPVITGLTPASGRAGTNVTLSGNNLLGVTEVLFNGVSAAFLPPTNNTAIYAVAPTNASTGPVRINAPPFSYTTNNFKYQPVVYSFGPGAGPADAVVTLNGANLNEGISAVSFGGAAATVVETNFATLKVKAPAAATNGPITVTTTNGSFTTFSNFYLPPVITSYQPNNPPPGPGATVTITGQHLIGTTNVVFNGWPARFTPPTSDTQLLVVVPTNVTTGPIIITTPAGSASSGRFYGMPVITGFSPTNGLPGVIVTITGTNFLDASSVKFNGLDAAILSNNGGVITVALPAGATTGPITVTAPAGTATSAKSFIVDFASHLTVKMISAPDPVFATSNLLYTITVTNAGPFDAPNAILLDILPPSVVLRSNSTTAGMIVVNGNTVTVNFVSFKIGDKATVKLTVAPQVVGQLENTAIFTSDYPDPDPSDNTASVTNLVLPLPLLKMVAYSPHQWRISWPLMLTNYNLEYISSPATNLFWSNLPTPPLIDGTNKFVIEADTEPSRFYRLGP